MFLLQASITGEPRKSIVPGSAADTTINIEGDGKTPLPAGGAKPKPSQGEEEMASDEQL